MPTLLRRRFQSDSPEATRALAAALAPCLPPGCLLRLEGDLGAGKTTFTQGLAKGLGLADAVQSPTFTLIREHRQPARPFGRAIGAPPAIGLVHMDFYRLDGPREVVDLGLEGYFEGPDLVVVEWPERAGEALGDEGLRVRLTLELDSEPPSAGDAPTDVRLVELTALDVQAAAALASLEAAAPGLKEIGGPAWEPGSAPRDG